jgi:hypothetical protein
MRLLCNYESVRCANTSFLFHQDFGVAFLEHPGIMFFPLTRCYGTSRNPPRSSKPRSYGANVFEALTVQEWVVVSSSGVFLCTHGLSSYGHE